MGKGATGCAGKEQRQARVRSHVQVGHAVEHIDMFSALARDKQRRRGFDRQRRLSQSHSAVRDTERQRHRNTHTCQCRFILSGTNKVARITVTSR